VTKSGASPCFRTEKNEEDDPFLVTIVTVWRSGCKCFLMLPVILSYGEYTGNPMCGDRLKLHATQWLVTSYRPTPVCSSSTSSNSPRLPRSVHMVLGYLACRSFTKYAPESPARVANENWLSAVETSIPQGPHPASSIFVLTVPGSSDWTIRFPSRSAYAQACRTLISLLSEYARCAEYDDAAFLDAAFLDAR